MEIYCFIDLSIIYNQNIILDDIYYNISICFFWIFILISNTTWLYWTWRCVAYNELLDLLDSSAGIVFSKQPTSISVPQGISSFVENCHRVTLFPGQPTYNYHIGLIIWAWYGTFMVDDFNPRTLCVLGWGWSLARITALYIPLLKLTSFPFLL